MRGKLIVEVGDAVWQRQLATLRHFLLRNLARELGAAVVTEIDFRPTPKRRPPQMATAIREKPMAVEWDGGIAPIRSWGLLYKRSQQTAVKMINEQDIRRVAELANLALSEEEIARMAKDLSGILTHVDTLNELDTSDVEPMSQVLFDADDTATLREDRERPPLSNRDAVGNAPAAGGGYFKVPKVIER